MTLANVYQLRDENWTFYRVLEEGGAEVKGNKGEVATMEEIKARLRTLYPDIVFMPTMAFSIEALRR